MLCLVSLVSCSEDDHRDQLAQQLLDQKINERLAQFTSVHLKDCEKDLMNDAIRTVDSLLRMNPILIRLDSLERPPKPVRPSDPAFDKPKEIEPLVPIPSPKKN